MLRASGTALRVVDGGEGHLLPVRAVAGILGVSRATVYALARQGLLLHVRVSNALRFDPAEVSAFITHRGRQA